MQAMTQEYCKTMDTYYGEAYAQANGTDEAGKLITLTDIRNNQQYTIGKLADGNCWMLDNLKIEDYNATAADTDLNSGSVVTNGYTLPAAIDSSTSYVVSETIPYIYSQIPGDTATGDTNYGYLYNWNVATAGETPTTMPGDGTNNDIAPNSICPRNWRMPVGGQFGAGDPDNEFDILNAKMAGFTSNQDSAYLADAIGLGDSASFDNAYASNWQFTGAFRGVLAGESVFGSFGQGVSGNLWSSRTRNGHSASPVWFSPSSIGGISHANGGGTYRGFSVRCIVAADTSAVPTVTIGGVAASVLSYTNNSITVKVPSHISGKVDVIVTRGADSFAIANGYEYVDDQIILPTIPTVPNTGRRVEI